MIKTYSEPMCYAIIKFTAPPDTLPKQAGETAREIASLVERVTGEGWSLCQDRGSTWSLESYHAPESERYSIERLERDALQDLPDILPDGWSLVNDEP